MADAREATVRAVDRSEWPELFPELARLRITVFREWPYLYEGTEAYERDYLDAYARSPRATLIGAFDGKQMVGAATAAPLSDHFDDFAEPFRERGWSADSFYYFGESVLLPAYRGKGTGVRFFEEREKAAVAHGFSRTTFSAVRRPADHPMRPSGHVPLDGFWRRRGYEKVEGLETRFSWTDIGEASATAKPMEFWMKRLTD